MNIHEAIEHVRNGGIAREKSERKRLMFNQIEVDDEGSKCEWEAVTLGEFYKTFDDLRWDLRKEFANYGWVSSLESEIKFLTKRVQELEDREKKRWF